MEDFLSPSSPMPADYADESDGDETFLESGCSDLFELIVEALLLVKERRR